MGNPSTPGRFSGNQIGGDTADWIEILNPHSTPVSTADFFLLDGNTRFYLPAMSLGAGKRIVIHCSPSGRPNILTSTLSWNRVTGAPGYHVYFGPGTNPGTLTLAGTASGFANSFVVNTPTTIGEVWTYNIVPLNSSEGEMTFQAQTGLYEDPRLLPFTAPFGLSPTELISLYRDTNPPAADLIDSVGPLWDSATRPPNAAFPRRFPGGISWGRSFASGTRTDGFFGVPTPGESDDAFQYSAMLANADAAGLAVGTNEETAKWNALTASLDVTAYIDYILTLAVTGKGDHENKQIVAWRNPRDGKYRLIAWDGDHLPDYRHFNPFRESVIEGNFITFTDYPDQVDLRPHYYLRSHPLYRIQFKERLRGTGGTGGLLRSALSQSSMTSRFTARFQEFSPLLEVQGMRWGTETLISPARPINEWTVSQGVPKPRSWHEQIVANQLAVVQSVRNVKDCAVSMGLYDQRPTTVPVITGVLQNRTITADPPGTRIAYTKVSGSVPLDPLSTGSGSSSEVQFGISPLSVTLNSGQSLAARREDIDPVDQRPVWAGMATATRP